MNIAYIVRPIMIGTNLIQLSKLEYSSTSSGYQTAGSLSILYDDIGCKFNGSLHILTLHVLKVRFSKVMVKPCNHLDFFKLINFNSIFTRSS